VTERAVELCSAQYLQAFVSRSGCEYFYFCLLSLAITQTGISNIPGSNYKSKTEDRIGALRLRFSPGILSEGHLLLESIFMAGEIITAIKPWKPLQMSWQPLSLSSV